MEYTIENFLCNIKSFLGYRDFDRFYAELLKVPNLQETFQKELAHNPEWLQVALKSCDENGFHIHFLLDYMHCIHIKPNELTLRLFCFGSVPTIKVTVYYLKG